MPVFQLFQLSLGYSFGFSDEDGRTTESIFSEITNRTLPDCSFDPQTGRLIYGAPDADVRVLDANTIHARLMDYTKIKNREKAIDWIRQWGLPAPGVESIDTIVDSASGLRWLMQLNNAIEQAPADLKGWLKRGQNICSNTKRAKLIKTSLVLFHSDFDRLNGGIWTSQSNSGS